MREVEYKTIGILGGMGPEATLCLFQLIISNTEASSDQEHLPVVICNLPQIPDRTRHIVYGEDSPLPGLQKGAETLKKAGADLVIISCNTAHYYLPSLRERVDISFIDMIAVTAAHVASRGFGKAGILATTGTINSGLYQKAFADSGVELLMPDALSQESLVMEAVYGAEGVKAGFRDKPLSLLREAVGILREKGAECIIGGCTEIPLVLDIESAGMPFVNSMELLAREAIVTAGGVCREKAGIIEQLSGTNQ
jgi:aspartate racemase